MSFDSGRAKLKRARTHVENDEGLSVTSRESRRRLENTVLSSRGWKSERGERSARAIEFERRRGHRNSLFEVYPAMKW